MFLPTNTTRPTFCLSQFTIAAALLAGLLSDAPAFAQSSRSGRSMMRRVQAMQKAQKQQSIQALQSQYAAAQKVLAQAQTEMASSGTALQSAESHLQVIEDQEAAKVRELAAATQSQRQVEERLIAAATPDSPVARALADLAEARHALQIEARRVLSLPAGTASDDAAALELMKLTSEQRLRLKADSGYQQAEDQVEMRQRQLREAEQRLFESQPDWVQAHARHQSQVEELKTIKGELKEAQANLGRDRQQARRAQTAFMSAQQVMQSTSTQLTALGAKPGTTSN